MKLILCLLLLAFLPQTILAAEPSLPGLMEEKLDGRDFSAKYVLSYKKDYTRYFITYKSGGLKISGIMNLPKGKGPFPVIITNHGFIHPSVYTVGRGLKREQDYLAKRGYIVIHPDYRNHGLSDKDPDQLARFRLGYVKDVINCILAVKNSNKKYFDKNKIGMLGHSLGGGIALNILVTRPDLVKSCVLFAPISMDARDNFERWVLGRGRRRTTRRRERSETAQNILSLYGSPESNPEFWDRLSAKTYLKNIKAPIILHHGTADESVPIEWSEKLAQALEEEGKTLAFHKYHGGKHEFISYWPKVMGRTVRFFDKHLK